MRDIDRLHGLLTDTRLIIKEMNNCILKCYKVKDPEALIIIMQYQFFVKGIGFEFKRIQFPIRIANLKQVDTKIKGK